MKQGFDGLIREGRDVEALRLFAKQYYDVGKMGYTRKQLLDRCADALELKCWGKEGSKKPVKNRKQTMRYTSAYSCPTCDGDFSGTGIANYCYHCGQKLDWD